MTELSGFWTTTGTASGHQQASYTQAHWSMAAEILAACSGFEGVAPAYLNQLVCADGGANTVTVGTGGAVVDGKWYKNDAEITFDADDLPSAVGSGNTRIDRIVLRCTWANYEAVATVISGTDAASPTAPAITQTSGTTYDIMLCQVLIDEAGDVTVTDERVFSTPNVDDTTIVISGSELQVKEGGISNTRIRDSAALSVIGRASNSTGDVADIAAGSDGHVLRRSGTSLAFGTVAAAGIANDAVDSQHYAAGSIDLEHMSANSIDSDQYVDGSIDTAHLANDAVDDTKVGNRVPQFYRRQGGSSTIWSTAGTTDYTPTTVRMQAGAVDIVVNTESPPGTWSGTTTITFDTAFSYAPLVFVSANSSVGFTYLNTGTISTTQAALIAVRAASGTVKVFWLAIGPE